MRGISLVCLLLAAGCRSVPELPAVDVSQAGWEVRQGQAVWKPNAKGPELSGELLWASHADGRFLLQFLKTPITLVEAQGGEAGWQISFPAQQRSFAGPRERTPHQRLGWLHLATALQGRELGSDWSFTRRGDRSWRLMNARTGEMIEGYLAQ